MIRFSININEFSVIFHNFFHKPIENSEVFLFRTYRYIEFIDVKKLYVSIEISSK